MSLGIYDRELFRVRNLIKENSRSKRTFNFSLDKQLPRYQRGMIATVLHTRTENIDVYSKGYGHPMMEYEDYTEWINCSELAGDCQSITNEWQVKYR